MWFLKPLLIRNSPNYISITIHLLKFLLTNVFENYRSIFCVITNANLIDFRQYVLGYSLVSLLFKKPHSTRMYSVYWAPVYLNLVSR